jgi:hypothetical protein
MRVPFKNSRGLASFANRIHRHNTYDYFSLGLVAFSEQPIASYCSCRGWFLHVGVFDSEAGIGTRHLLFGP